MQRWAAAIVSPRQGFPTQAPRLLAVHHDAESEAGILTQGEIRVDLSAGNPHRRGP